MAKRNTCIVRENPSRGHNPKILLQCVADFSQLRPCFDDPDGQKVDPDVVNLLSKNQPDPTVNK
ncbi:hypothetical protein MTR_4g031400 [Medicago truncatula]|uniref:Uncharacterized protein n=1 Tax=Medicago truncatula TaxID=3880 RepID=G7JLZ4_MEDTR|nr:hypothetical protein MTR_4g031400 [Medicago truncatula]